ncbi:metal-dependent hydrolase [Aeropyrum camini]|uniref:metal-dependent hydrolase n=1 Tax=Aeropyrum camini TaxID=229980 RepID=UPI0009EB2A0C|nr:metal-dependent hydrolase [Aeropyrum camini]
MNREGHFGMAMAIVFGVYSILDVKSIDSIFLGFLIVGLSTLPDIDLALEIAHRKYTHNLAASIIAGLLIGVLLESGGVEGLGFLEGFIAGFTAVWIHILGDLMTYMEFQPLWPLSKGRWRLNSSNPATRRSTGPWQPWAR